MKSKLTFTDTALMVINSVEEGVMDKATAVARIEEAAEKKCAEYAAKVMKDLQVSLMALERAVEEFEGVSNPFPLDTMTVEQAQDIYKNKGMLLLCNDGHVINVFRESTNKQEEGVV